ncbi:hypothetical protein C1645_835658 [Glomus cerebriforme]|uniref:Uncharacterized protein n=1 Tax=Glomus cerebriforme TaxID=658196 RepID=A0A397SC06_9GLOM|nr:hypothetical protein C1645_835658 [Glomus cerebriforme]
MLTKLSYQILDRFTSVFIKAFYEYLWILRYKLFKEWEANKILTLSQQSLSDSSPPASQYNKKVSYYVNDISFNEFKHPVLDKQTRLQQAATQSYKMVQDYIYKGCVHAEFFFKKIHRLSDKIQNYFISDDFDNYVEIPEININIVVNEKDLDDIYDNDTYKHNEIYDNNNIYEDKEFYNYNEIKDINYTVKNQLGKCKLNFDDSDDKIITNRHKLDFDDSDNSGNGIITNK